MTKDLNVLDEKSPFANQLKLKNYRPDWGQFKLMVDGIFSRKYYTNHGVLAQRFEDELRDLLGAKHAICMTNTGIGVMIASISLGLKGKVILPAFSHISVIQAVKWAGLEPVLCDVDPKTYHLNTEAIITLIDENTSAILGVNIFGGSCEYEKLEEIAARHSLKIYFISSDAIGQEYKGKKIGNYGCCEIFSLNESNIINSTDGCVISTNDDFIAARLRNMRSSYGAGLKVPIEFTGNGRMSEVQAGMGLLMLEKFEKNSAQNKEVFEIYDSLLTKIKGIEVFKPEDKISKNNHQKMIVMIHEKEFGISAGELSKTLELNNVLVNNFKLFNSSLCLESISSGFQVAEVLSSSLLELPLGGIKIHEARLICELILRAKRNVNS